MVGFFGALQGAGQGIAAVGAERMRAQDYADHQALIEGRQLDLLAAREAARGDHGAGGGKIALSEVSGLDPLSPEAANLRANAGFTPEQERQLREARSSPDFVPTPGDRTRQSIDRGDTGGAQAVPKLDPAASAKIHLEAAQALRRAFGLTTGGTSADSIAKAETEEAAAADVKRYDAGDAAGGRGALLYRGKDVMSPEGTDVVTGAPAKGSVAEARRGEVQATAGEKTAHAGEHVAKAGELAAQADKLHAEISGDFKKWAPEKLTSALNSINSLIKTYDSKSLNDDDIAARQRLQTLATNMTTTLTQKFGLDASGKPMAAAGTGTLPKTSLSDLRRADNAMLDQAPPQAPTDPGQRRVGVKYMTPRGPLIWRGTGWSSGG